MSTKPAGMNVGGRLSFNHLTAQSAYDSAHRPGSKLAPQYRPKTVQDAKANFNLLLNKTGYERVKEHILEEVLPWFREQVQQGNPKIYITKDQIDTLEKHIKDDVYNERSGRTPFRPVDDKTAELAPATAAVMIIKAYRNGADIEQQAFVTDEEQLVSKPFSSKAIFPIKDTVFELYPGCYVKATISFWVGEASGDPFITANANAVVFWKDADRFGGSSSDVDGMIEDDDDLFLD